MKNILFFFLFLPLLACAQMDSTAENALKNRVKALDEFISRFNYEIDTKGETVVNRLDMKARKRQLLMLLDMEMAKKANAEQRKAVEGFINQVAPDSSKFWLIRFKDMDWYAEAQCQIKFKGKPEKIKVVLKVETDTNQVARWSIVGLQSSFVELKAKDSGVFLSPVSHELNFMQLSEATNKAKENTINFAPIDYRPDPLSIFFYLVKSGELQIDYVEKITYHFLQIPNYIFTVEHFERAGNNVGWLISSVQAADSKQKAAYRRKLGL